MQPFKSQSDNLINYEAILNGKLNGQDILVKGIGTIQEGITNGNYDLVQFPKIIDPQILKIVLITGYPNACFVSGGGQNIFGDKSYQYKRSVKFSNGGHFNIEVDVKREGNHLFSHFQLKGKCPAVDITATEPMVEIWVPNESGKLDGRFRLCWKKPDGGYLFGDAASLYSPASSTLGLPIYHRYLEIEATMNTDRSKMHLLQQSRLFSQL